MRRHHGLPDSRASFKVEIEKLTYGGEGLGRVEGRVVFVPFTVPGDLVEVRPAEKKKNYIRAVVTRILKPGPGRRDPSCPHFGRCGGCQWQHLEYSLQVETKRKILEEAFHHHFPETRKLSISVKASPEEYGYRSRARVQLRGGGTAPAVGFFRYRSRTVEDVDLCPLFRPSLNEALAAVRRAHLDGCFGSREQEVGLACAEDGSFAYEAVVPEGSPSEQHCREILLRHVGEFRYAAEPSVFFQANDFLIGDLVAAVMSLTLGKDAALDLYAGVGLFSLPLARRYGSVVAVEGSAGAHRLCVRNASDAGFENVQAVCAEVEDWIQAVGSIAAPAFDLILLDPPRHGAGPEVMKHLGEWAPETMVYISCDPQTLIRDLASLPARHYQIDFIAGLDLFPQTFHIETVVRLRRR
jgi:23S rRNA (uracil1939-C5)-methyltransferase